jgi:hypothetical protein
MIDMPSALSDLPTIKAALSSIRSVLSSTSKLHGTDLYILESDGNSLRLVDHDKEHDAPPVPVGSRVPRMGVAAEVLDLQKPVFLPDLSEIMAQIPDLAPFAAV